MAKLCFTLESVLQGCAAGGAGGSGRRWGQPEALGAAGRAENSAESVSPVRDCFGV